MTDNRRYTQNLSRCEIKAWKEFSLDRIRIHDLRDTSGVLYQLSYQANWELVTFWVRNIALDGKNTQLLLTELSVNLHRGGEYRPNAVRTGAVDRGKSKDNLNINITNKGQNLLFNSHLWYQGFKPQIKTTQTSPFLTSVWLWFLFSSISFSKIFWYAQNGYSLARRNF